MISVVIPLYNKAQTILNTLNTVMNQTYPDFEVVIVNDGSTDNSVEVVNMHFHDPRIRIINQKNSGVSAARNRGIDEAQGEWIAFLDADDEWLPTYLETIVSSINKNSNSEILITARYSQNYETKFRKASIPKKLQGKITQIDFFENPHVYMHISATVIKKTLLWPKMEWNRFIIGQKSNEDFTFLFRLALHSSTVEYIGIPLSVYNGEVSQQATSVLDEQQKIKDGALFRNRVWEEWHNTGCKNKTCKIFMKYETRHCFLIYLKRKQYKEIHTFLKQLSSTYKHDILNRVELVLYEHIHFRYMAIMYIYITKLIWRTHNYPVV